MSEAEHKKVHHGHYWMPVVYVSYYGILKEVVNECGYAIAIHGSVTRDFDLVLIPWVESASSHEIVLFQIRKAIGIERSDGMPYDSKEEKPHGRTAYTIQSGSGGYLDISIMKL